MTERGRNNTKKNEIPYNYPLLNIMINFKDENTLAEKNFYLLVFLDRLKRRGHRKTQDRKKSSTSHSHTNNHNYFPTKIFPFHQTGLLSYPQTLWPVLRQCLCPDRILLFAIKIRSLLRKCQCKSQLPFKAHLNVNCCLNLSPYSSWPRLTLPSGTPAFLRTHIKHSPTM